MSIQKIISNYCRYNHWANERMVHWLKTLETALLYKETLSSFRSIDLTVQHMNNAQNFWFAAITETDVAKLDERIKFNAADINMNDLLSGSKQMLTKFGSYTEEDLSKQIAHPHVPMVQSRYEYILHVVNHNSYHRGQIVTMSRFLGIVKNIPEMDYETFLWFDR